MNTTHTIDRAALVTVTGGAGHKPTTTPTEWRPCETSPRYDEWLRTHPQNLGGK
jgi:hypothetical protein